MARRGANTWLLLACMMLLAPMFISPQSARATTLERLLVMPGPVIEGHAEIEDDCTACHTKLSDDPQYELCVVCHKNVGRDLEEGLGYHGRLPSAQRRECATCHTDHEGRDKDIVALDEATFDHSMTNFVLLGAHEEAVCTDCHVPNRPHRQAETTCIGCHRDDDTHNGQLGEACNDCHTVNDWQEAKFDHNATSFPLTGRHENVVCSACHLSEVFTEVGTTCADCHREDDVHKGRNGEQCADCHVTSSWSKVTFDHQRVSGFPLDGGHRWLTCKSCHRADDFKDLGGSNCNSCHSDEDVHEGRNGTDCASCHVTSDWKKTSFNHAATGFALPDGHDSLECTACHVDNVEDAIPRDCGGCHVDDDVHEGQLGATCEACHSAISWTEEIQFDHDLTRFPLVGKHADVVCNDCHASPKFHDVEDGCMDCHEKDDKHDGTLGTECEVCHNPSDWKSWIFDHDAQTEFALTGSHSGLDCATCHSKPDLDETPQNCRACHEREDPHLGRFGTDCGRCHTTSSFSEIKDI